MRSASQYISDLAARGRYSFTTGEASTAMGSSDLAVRASLRRLAVKGQIAQPYRGFHVIVPPEFRALGCLPAAHFISQLMAHLNEPYYVGLLSAAELHGAAHHRPQRFQVMVATHRRPLTCGKVHVQFVARKDLARSPVIEQNTPRGRLRVASPEVTAFELVGYADVCGGLDNVATVLGELVEVIDRGKLGVAASLQPIAWVQRLGYLLDLADQRALADALVPHVAEHAHAIAPLVRASPRAGATRVPRWKLAVNAIVEPDR